MTNFVFLVAWLGIVPLTAFRTYRFFFSGSLDMLVSLPFELFSTGKRLSMFC